jgi:type VI secretion system protein ImpI
MILEFTVTKKSEPDYSEKLSFNRFPVFIGREEKNDVILPDPFKVVSRKHAKIVNTEGILQVVDLESANFSFLNGERVIPNEENAIKSGDVIKIGEYELIVELVQEKEQVFDDDQKTMVFSSPFAGDVSAILESIQNLSVKYAFDDTPGKSDMLRLSILQSFSSFEKNDVGKILAEYFSEHYLDRPRKIIPQQPEIKSEVKIKETPKQEQQSFIRQTKQSDSAPLSPDFVFSSHFSNVSEILIETFASLIQGFLQFRQEFFGVTIYHTMPVGSLKELKEFLFTPDISPEEEQKRIALLKEETQKLMTHQIGLLEGYRTSITEGSKGLLQSLDPVTIEKEMQIKNQQAGGLNPGKILPFLQKAKVLDVIKENYSKYMSDLYHVEKKYFRPAFMKGYQKRISASPQHNEY